MARTDWIAVVTAPSAEYTASIDLARFCLHPYLPQQCRRTNIDGAFRLRRFPLFPRYLLLPIKDLDYHVLRVARGVQRITPILTSPEGQVWRAPATAVERIQRAEESGEYDEKLKLGTEVRVKSKAFADISMFIAVSNNDMVELFTPLLGGARLRTDPQNVVITQVP